MSQQQVSFEQELWNEEPHEPLDSTVDTVQSLSSCKVPDTSGSPQELEPPPRPSLRSRANSINISSRASVFAPFSSTTSGFSSLSAAKFGEEAINPQPESTQQPMESPATLGEEERRHSYPFHMEFSEPPAEASVQYISVLPPVDGGFQAWSFLAAASVLGLIIWGLPFSIGIFHEYWVGTVFNGQGESTLTLTATLQGGLLYMSTAAFGP